MAIDVTINGVLRTNASDYSVTEDSTPIDPSDTTGGTGTFTVSVPQHTGTKLLFNKPISLSDGGQGTTLGSITGLGGDTVNSTLTASSRLNVLNVTRTAQPYQGTLEGAFRYYLGLVGVTSGIVVDSGISTSTVTFPGWKALVWDQIKALMAAKRTEVSLVSNNVVLRPIRQRTAVMTGDTTESWTIDANSIAQSVQINYYQSQAKTSALAYPLGGWTSDLETYQVDAGATVTYDISLDSDDTHTLGASITNINQPVCVASVSPTYSASSVYTVSGNDGLPITPAQWTAQGGSVTVKINPDTRSLTLAIRGASASAYGPYTIGMSSGDNTYYSSLRLTGDGVFYDRQNIILKTGNSVDVAPTEIGAVVDSPFINTLDEAYQAGIWTLAAYTGPARGVTVNTTSIARKGQTDSYVYMTAAQFNADPDFAGKTADQFNTQFAGLTTNQFNALQFAKVQNDFTNQAFGNVAGARVFLDGGWYRIRSVPGITPASLSYSAQADDTMDDFNTFYAGMTADQFNARLGSRTASEFNGRPFVSA